MRIRSSVISTILILGSASVASTTWANRIPGIPIMIKCPCPGPVYVESQRCCTKSGVSLVAGAVGSGSAAIDATVLLQGRCAYACNPGDPGDGRIDDGDAGPFAMSLPPMT